MKMHIWYTLIALLLLAHPNVDHCPILRSQRWEFNLRACSFNAITILSMTYFYFSIFPCTRLISINVEFGELVRILSRKLAGYLESWIEKRGI